MADAEPINATKQKAIQLLGVNMAEAVQRDGGRLTDDQIHRVFDMPTLTIRPSLARN